MKNILFETKGINAPTDAHSNAPTNAHSNYYAIKIMHNKLDTSPTGLYYNTYACISAESKILMIIRYYTL